MIFLWKTCRSTTAHLIFRVALLVWGNFYMMGGGLVYAQEPIRLSADVDEYLISSDHVAIFKDTSQSLYIHDILELSNTCWEVPKQRIPAILDLNSNYWVRIQFEDKLFLSKDWFIESLVSLTDENQFFYKTETGFIRASAISGRKYPFDQKEYPYKNFLYDLPHAEKFKVYFRVNGEVPIHMLYKIRSKRDFIQFSLSEYYLLALFYGALLILGLYNFISFISLKRSVYLYLCLHIFACFCFFSVEDGLAFQFFWPDLPQINKILFNGAPFLFLVTFTLFFWKFFEIRQQNGQFFTFSLAIVGLTLIYNCVESLFFGKYMNVGVHLVPFTLFLGYAAHKASRNHKPGFLFVLAFACTYVGLVFLVTRKYMLLDWNWQKIYLIYSLNIGLIIELVFLSIAMNLQLRQEEAEQYEELKHVNHQLQQKNQDLLESMRSNSELEAFAYSLSHDLRQPLINIQSFSGLLANSLNRDMRLREKEKKMLNFIEDSTKNMDQLITGILEYSKIESDTEHSEFTFMEIIRLCKINLHKRIEESCASITCIGCENRYTGSKVKFVQLFQNLISNAIKFSKPGDNPQVQISARRSARELTIAIRDNGIGIDPKHISMVFEVLFKKHQSAKMDGYGIGLASCKKIVEGHGGKIWAESKPDCGTTFFISLPQKKS